MLLPDRTGSVLALVLALGLGPLAAGCSEERAPRQSSRLADVGPEPAFDADAEPAVAVLSLVPQEARTITVTDWDAIRVQLGRPDLTSEDLMTDRLEFWRRAEAESAALTDGLLRAEESRLALDYGFTQDDVDWEARFTGEQGAGFVVGLRPDLPLDGVRRAVSDGVGPLAGARLLTEDHLVVKGVAEEDVWADEPGWARLADDPVAATYLHRGCVPLDTALGPDAGVEEREALRRLQAAGNPVAALATLEGFVISYGDRGATFRVEPGRPDLVARLRMGEDWPVSGFPQAYVDGAADPSTGRIGYTVPRPPVAVGLALVEELPFAVCNEVVPVEEPTGR